MEIYGLKETSYLKATILGTVTQSGNLSYYRTVAKIRTLTLGNPSAPTAGVVQLQGVSLLTQDLQRINNSVHISAYNHVSG